MNLDSPDSSSSSPSTSTGVLMMSRDLMFASRVKTAARQAGLDCRIATTLPEQGDPSVRFVILDLSTRSELTGEIVDWCASRCPAAKLIAYGPHVQVGKLDAARQAGIATVLTNGQFNSQLSSLFGV